MSKRRLAALLFCIAVVASLALAHGALIGYRTYANLDEAYASAIASRLLDGYTLYDGAISQRGPFMYGAFAIFARVFGWDNIVALRCCALALAIAEVAAIYFAGRALLTRSAAVVAAAVTTYALVFGFPAMDGVAINGEPLQFIFVVGAAALGALAMRRTPGSPVRKRLLVFSGFAWGCATAIKPQVLPQIAPIVIWLVVDASRRKSAPRALAADLVSVLLSVAAVPLGCLAYAGANGTLGAMLYYTITYNAHVHLASGAVPWVTLVFTHLHEEPGFYLVTTFLCAYAFAFLRRRVRAVRREKSAWALARGFGTRTYLALHLVIALVVATGMERFFPHYYLVALPFLAWLLGAIVAPAFRSSRHCELARAALVAFMIFIVGAGAMECVIRERFDGRVAHDRATIDVSKYVHATTDPTRRIFVWGFSPWIYGYSQRKPAGRYVFSTYVTGFVPWFWEAPEIERNRIVPGSVDALLGDLEREDPDVVVDAGSVMISRSMRAYEAPAKFLRARYCFEVRIGAYDVYRRKRDGVSCETPFFPAPHWAIDALGRPLPVPMPPVVDAAATRPLPLSPYYEPVTFPGVRMLESGLAAIAHRPGETIWAEEIDPADLTPAARPERSPPLMPREK